MSKTTTRTTRQRLAATAAVVALAFGGLVAGAAPASAHYNFDHKPATWACKWLGWCTKTWHYTCGDPRIAYNVSKPPCWGHYYWR